MEINLRKKFCASRQRYQKMTWFVFVDDVTIIFHQYIFFTAKIISKILLIILNIDYFMTLFFVETQQSFIEINLKLLIKALRFCKAVSENYSYTLIMIVSRINRDNSLKKLKSKSSRAEIVFPVARIHRHLKSSQHIKFLRCGVGAGVYTAAVLEYLTGIFEQYIFL